MRPSNYRNPRQGYKCQTENAKVSKQKLENEVPTCAVCMEKLGTYGGPASLSCGHNGCLECLQKVQIHSADPVCPLCRTPFDAEWNLGLNVELRDALQRAEASSSTSTRLSCEELGSYVVLDPWWQGQEPPECNPAQGNRYNSPSQQETPIPVSWNNWSEQDERTSMGSPRALPPEINVWNLLCGMIAILTGRGRSQIDELEGSGGAVEERSGGDMWASVYFPSSAHLLSGPEVDVMSLREVLEAAPPRWVPDSASNTCMQCNANFRPLTRGRHHCRFCGGIFCRVCSRGKCLLPVKFMDRDPQRVCDACYEKLEPVQRTLIDCISNASQIAVHDVTDLSCMRGWLNSPLGLSMEQEIYKATNTLRNFCKVGKLKPEGSIPAAVLRGAKGLAILTVIRVGMMVTYKLGTGLVVLRRDGTWSAPSAVISCGLGWGAQVGGELTDFIIVLRTSRAVKAFSGHIHLSVGAGISAAAGPLGRAAEADLHVGDGGAAACYTYSCSQGAFIGVSFEGNVVSVRADTNTRFYGDPYLTHADILSGAFPRPRAAAPLYAALHDLFEQVGTM
eukprot:c26205_g1_i2 orf=424-2112(+)